MSRRVQIVLLSLLLPGLAVTGCNDSTTDPEYGGSIIGVWTGQTGELTTYLGITEDSLTVYIGNDATCFDQIEFEIVSSTGDTYTLRDIESGLSGVFLIRRAGSTLEVQQGTNPNVDPAIYTESNANVDALEVCTGGGGDPSIVCSELPAVSLGETVSGTLSSSDPASSFGPYYDLFGLRLDAAGEVTVRMASSEFDSFLYLYEAGGNEIARNDDVSDGDVNAAVTLELEPGCYRIEATSFEAGETGAYTLSVQ